MDRRTIYVSTAPHPDQFFRVRLLSFLHSSAVQTVWINRFSLLALMIYRSQKSLNVRASGCCFLFFLILNTFDSIQHNTVQCCSFSKLSSWPNRGKRLLWCISFFFSLSPSTSIDEDSCSVFVLRLFSHRWVKKWTWTANWSNGCYKQICYFSPLSLQVSLFWGGIGAGGWG